MQACGEFLDGSLKAQAPLGNGNLDIAKLQQELTGLQAERQTYNRLSFIFDVPRIVLTVFADVIAFSNSGSSNPGAGLFVLSDMIVLAVGLGYYAKYKGRSAWLGLLGFLTIKGLIVLLCPRDFKRERIREITLTLNIMSMLGTHGIASTD